MKKIKAKYWYRVVWVNPKVEPKEGYFTPKLNSIYGENTKQSQQEHHVYNEKTMDFLHHYTTELILKLKEHKTKEVLADLLDKAMKNKELI